MYSPSYLRAKGLEGFDGTRAEPLQFNRAARTLLLISQVADFPEERRCFLRHDSEDVYRRLQISDKDLVIRRVVTPIDAPIAFVMCSMKSRGFVHRIDGPNPPPLKEGDQEPPEFAFSIGYGWGRIFEVELPSGISKEIHVFGKLGIAGLVGCTTDGKCLFMSIVNHAKGSPASYHLASVDRVTGAAEILLTHKASPEF